MPFNRKHSHQDSPPTPKTSRSLFSSFRFSPTMPAFNLKSLRAASASASNVSLPTISLLPPTPTLPQSQAHAQQSRPQQEPPRKLSSPASTCTLSHTTTSPDGTPSQSKVQANKSTARPAQRRIPPPSIGPNQQVASKNVTAETKTVLTPPYDLKSLSPVPSPPEMSAKSPPPSFSRVPTTSPPAGRDQLTPDYSLLTSSSASSVSVSASQSPALSGGPSAGLEAIVVADIPASGHVVIISDSPAPDQEAYPVPDEKADDTYSRPFRYLLPSEARQISHLMNTHLLPVRNSSKGMMRECILLSDKLDKAGVKWDRHRRVMGLHLRGIWEEGNKGLQGGSSPSVGMMGSAGDGWSPKGSGACQKGCMGGGEGCQGGECMRGLRAGRMELYILGSFLTRAEEPHPLDTTPLQIPIDPVSFPSASRSPHQLSPYSVSSSLANSSITSLLSTLPGVPGEFVSARSARSSSGLNFAAVGSAESIDVEGQTNLDQGFMKYRRSWKERKNASLRISTKGHTPSKIRQSALSAISLMSASELKWTKTPIKKAHKTIRKAAAKVSGARSATGRGLKSAARIGFGGWEVR